MTMQIRKATDADYIAEQGWKPKIEVKGGGLINVVHDDGTVVPTRESDLAQTVFLDVGGGLVEFLTYLLKRFHGDPCEGLTRREGGKGMYDRR